MLDRHVVPVFMDFIPSEMQAIGKCSKNKVLHVQIEMGDRVTQQAHTKDPSLIWITQTRIQKKEMMTLKNYRSQMKRKKDV